MSAPSLLCILSMPEQPPPDTIHALAERGLHPHWVAIGYSYFGRIDSSLDDVIAWLTALDWTGLSDMPTLQFADDDEMYSYKLYAGAAR